MPESQGLVVFGSPPAGFLYMLLGSGVLVRAFVQAILDAANFPLRLHEKPEVTLNWYGGPQNKPHTFVVEHGVYVS